MKIKSLDDINGNEVVLEDIRSGLDFILVPKGTIIKKTYVPALKNLGISEIMVEDGNTKCENNECSIPKEIIDTYTNHLTRIYQQYKDGQGFGEIEILAEKIVDFCKDNPKIKICSKMTRSYDVFEHSVMVSILCILTGMQMDIVRPKLYQMAIASLIHDFSLLALPFNFYDKELEELSEEEQQQMMQHSRKSYEIVANQLWMTQEAKEMVLAHHERMNGRGYPDKKANHCILCRIIQATDAMDGMLSGIEYAKKSFNETIDFMESHKTCRYDRSIVEIVCQLFAK